MNRVLYREWFPQIVYNHHQTGPAGTVMFAPPFRDPFNYNFDPLVVDRHRLVGAAMHTRFVAEGKPGVTMRSGAELLDVVERRPAHHGVLPQPDRPADRDHRQPDADRDSLRARSTSCRAATCRSRSRRRRGISASRSTTRSPPTRRCSTSRRATARRSSTTSTDGPELDRARQPRHLDDDAAATSRKCRRRSPRTGSSSAHRPAASSAGGAGQRRVPAKYYATAAQARVRAIRAATSCRPTRPTSPPRRSSSTSLIKTGVTVHRATRAVHGRRQALSGRLVRRQDGAGVPPARARHVRAAGSSQRLPYPGGPPTPPYDSRRLDAGATRWACSSIASSTRSTARSRRSPTVVKPPPAR